jgi:hypothetical protein
MLYEETGVLIRIGILYPYVDDSKVIWFCTRSSQLQMKSQFQQGDEQNPGVVFKCKIRLAGC